MLQAVASSAVFLNFDCCLATRFQKLPGYVTPCHVSPVRRVIPKVRITCKFCIRSLCPVRNNRKHLFCAPKFETLRSRHNIHEDESESAGIACMHSLPLAVDGRHFHDSAFYRWLPLNLRLGCSRACLDTAVLLFLVAQFLVLCVY